MTPGAMILTTAAAGAVGAGALALRALRAGPATPVLRYHLVGPTLPGSAINDQRLPMSQLEAQLRHLVRRGYEAVTLTEAVAWRGRPGRRVALTFDGPWAAFARAVWPALRRAGLARATLFFPPDRLGQDALDVGEGRPEPLLPAADLAHLAATGVEVGVQWTRRPVEGPLVDALRGARLRLEAAIGQPVVLIALPSGAPARVVRAARRAGLRGAALHGGDGLLRRRTSPWAVPRLAVERDLPLLDLACALGGGRA
ncbi:MAG: polysaccharide deacetylase family protein [Planctomycetes bacterium]|nr:polysaccharide deacetylase family protein [Planctomycetota bacterium]